MRVELTKDEEGKAIGYKLLPDNVDDKKVLGSIRNMHFWGLGDKVIKYDGITDEDIEEEQKSYVTSIKFIQKKHQK